MNFEFGNVLTRAWQIIWKHKVLWIFGILASCTRGGNGGGNSGGGNRTPSSGGGPNPGQFGNQFEQVGRWLENNVVIVVAIVCFIILLYLALMALGFIGKVALIKGTYQAEKGAESLAFGELFSESLPYFWRVFGLSFLIGLAVMVIMIPFILIGALTAGVGLLCLIPLICLLIPVGLVVSVVLEQANAAIVLEDLSLFDGLKRGWEVSKQNAGPVALMALILLVGGAVVGGILALPFILAFLPIIFGAAAGGANAAIWVGVACAVVYLPVIILLNGILTAYIQSAWTLTFMRLTSAPKKDEPTLIEVNP